MKISLFIANHVEIGGSGCGIVGIATDELKRSKRRSYSYYLFDSHQDMTNVQSFRLALTSLKSTQKDSEITLNVSNGDMYKLFNDLYINDDLPDSSDASYARAVLETRKWCRVYSNVVVQVVSTSDPLMSDAYTLARSVAENKINTDSE